MSQSEKYKGKLPCNVDFLSNLQLCCNKKKWNIPILDTCCGSKMFYFDKHDDRVLFQDIRKMETTLCDGRHFEVNPDVQADFTNMPYSDNYILVGTQAELKKYIGNAVEVNMSKVLCESLCTALISKAIAI